MDSCQVEDLIKEYVRLRKKYAKEYNYRFYAHYATGVKGSICNPINAMKFILNLLRNFVLKEYPENHDLEFLRDTYEVYNQIYKEIYSKEGFEICGKTLSRSDLVKIKYILEIIIHNKSGYTSYLTFSLPLFGGLILSGLFSKYYVNSITKPLIVDLIMIIVMLLLFFGFIPQFITNIIFKLTVYKELLVIIDRRLREFDLEGILKPDR